MSADGIIAGGIQGAKFIYDEITRKKRLKEQEEMQKRLNEATAGTNYRYGELAAHNQYQRQIEMWNMQNQYNTPEEQIARLRKAGLSPALMYGGGQGASGQSSPMTASKGDTGGAVAGEATKALDIERAQNEKINQGIMAQQSIAQTKLMEAEAKKAEVEANKISGVDTDKVSEEINKLGVEQIRIKEEVDNIKASTEGTRIKNIGSQIENSMKAIDLYINQETKDDKIEAIRLGNKKLIKDIAKLSHEVQSARIKAWIDQETYEDVVSEIAATAANKWADLELTGVKTIAEEMGIVLSSAQITKINTELNLAIKNYELEIQKLLLETMKFGHNAGIDHEKLKIEMEKIKAGIVEQFMQSISVLGLGLKKSGKIRN